MKEFSMPIKLRNGDGRDIWKIYLAGPQAPYPFVLFHRKFEGLERYTTMIVDLERFIDCFERDGGYVIPEMDGWTDQKISYITNHLNPSRHEQWMDAPLAAAFSDFIPPALNTRSMPIAGIEVRKRVIPAGILGLFGKPDKKVDEAVVKFTNGRHRARFLQAMGVKAVPIEVEWRDLEAMQYFCGAEI